MLGPDYGYTWVMKAPLSGFLNFFYFLRLLNLGISSILSLFLSRSWLKGGWVWDIDLSFSSNFCLSSYNYLYLCSIFFYFDCIKIFNLVFSFSDISKLFLSLSSSRHFLDNSSWTFLSSLRTKTYLSDWVTTISCTLLSSPSFSSFLKFSVSNLIRFEPILKRLKRRILLINLVV